MSETDIDRLVAERSLERQNFRDEDIVSLWSKAATSYADAGVPGLSTDGAFQNIYRAALQASIATLAAYGLQVRARRTTTKRSTHSRSSPTHSNLTEWTFRRCGR